VQPPKSCRSPRGLVNLQGDDALIPGQPWHQFPYEFAEVFRWHQMPPCLVARPKRLRALCDQAAQQESCFTSLLGDLSHLFL
jgi:hypothetical protein